MGRQAASTAKEASLHAASTTKEAASKPPCPLWLSLAGAGLLPTALSAARGGGSSRVGSGPKQGSPSSLEEQTRESSSPVFSLLPGG